MSRYEDKEGAKDVTLSTCNFKQLIATVEENQMALKIECLNRGDTESIDINKIVCKIDPTFLESHFDFFVAQGANIETIISRLGASVVVKYIDTITAHGVALDIDALVRRMGYHSIMRNLELLLSYGANPNGEILHIMWRNNPKYGGLRGFNQRLMTLLSYGTDIQQVVENLNPRYVIKYYDCLVSHGAKIDFNHLASRSQLSTIGANLDFFITHGAKLDIDAIVSRMSSKSVAKRLEMLLSIGVDPKLLITRMSPTDIQKTQHILVAHGLISEDFE